MLTALSVAVPLLAACAASMPRPGLPPPSRLPEVSALIAAGSSPDHGDAKKPPLLYLAGPSNVEVYRVGRYERPVREITDGIDNAKGTAVDSSGNLYVANNALADETVQVYALGASQPSRTYQGGIYGPIYDPSGIAVTRNGTLYVANACCAGSPWGNVVSVFPPDRTKASEFLSLPGGFAPNYVAVDSQSNLFVSSADGGAVFEFSDGSSAGKGLNLKLAGSAGIAFDGAGHLVVADVDNKTINVYKLPATKPIRQLILRDEPGSIAFTKNYSTLLVTGWSSGNLYSIAYATGKVSSIQHLGSGFASVALSPAAYP